MKAILLRRPGDPISDRNATKSLSSIDRRNPPLFQSHDAEAGGEALFGMGPVLQVGDRGFESCSLQR